MVDKQFGKGSSGCPPLQLLDSEARVVFMFTSNTWIKKQNKKNKTARAGNPVTW